MSNSVRDENDARLLLLLPQIWTWPFLIKLILLAKTHWREVLSYQALSDHPSLPLDVQKSQHMVMIAVCPIE